MMNRRGVLSFLGGGLIAAPAIVKCVSLMPVRGIIMPVYGDGPTLEAVALNERLIAFRREVTREYVRANLFKPVPAAWERLLGDTP